MGIIKFRRGSVIHFNSSRSTTIDKMEAQIMSATTHRMEPCCTLCGDRPHVIVSCDSINGEERVCTLAPIRSTATNTLERAANDDVTVKMLGGRISHVDVTNLVTVNQCELNIVNYMGMLSEDDMERIDEAICRCLAPSFYKRYTELLLNKQPIVTDPTTENEEDVVTEEVEVSTDEEVESKPSIRTLATGYYVNAPWSDHVNLIKLKQDCWTYSTEEVMVRIKYCSSEDKIGTTLKKKFNTFLANVAHRYNATEPVYQMRTYKKNRIMTRLTDEQVLEFRNDIETLSVKELSIKYEACENELNEMKYFYIERVQSRKMA